MDLIIILDKRFIYTCDVKKYRLCLAGFKNFISFIFNLEKHRYIRNGHYCKFLDNCRQNKNLDLKKLAVN